jgi:predicted Zn-dependent protease
VILERELRSAVRLAEGAGEEAVALLREATALEDGMPFEFGPPVAVKPSHELLGETLLALGRAAEAQRAFGRALALAPGRALALRGLARAAAAAGDTAAAGRARGQLRAMHHAADTGVGAMP